MKTLSIIIPGIFLGYSLFSAITGELDGVMIAFIGILTAYLTFKGE